MNGTARRIVKDAFRAALGKATAARGGDPEIAAAACAVLERLAGRATATLVAREDTERWAVLDGVIEALCARGATVVIWPIGRRWGTALPLGGLEALVAALAVVEPAFESGQGPGTSEDLAHEARLRLSGEALRARDIVLIVDAAEDAVGFSPRAILEEAASEGGARVLCSGREGAGDEDAVLLRREGTGGQRGETGEQAAGGGSLKEEQAAGGEDLAELVPAVALALAPAPIPVLAAVTGGAPARIAAHLAEVAGERGPLCVEDGGISYGQSGWRAAVEAALPPAERGRVHAAFAEAASRAARGAPGSEERVYWAACRAGHLELSGAPWTAFVDLVDPAWEALCAAAQAPSRGRIEDARSARRAAQRAAAGALERRKAPAGASATGRAQVDAGERARASAFAVRAALVESSLRARRWGTEGPLADSAAAAQLLASWAELAPAGARERLSALSREVARREPRAAQAMLAAAAVSPGRERAALVDEALRCLPDEPAERLEALAAAAGMLAGEAPGAAGEGTSAGGSPAEGTSAEGALDEALGQVLSLVSAALLGAFQRAIARWRASLCARAADRVGTEHPLRRSILALLAPRLGEPARSAWADRVARDALAALSSGRSWDAAVYEDLRRVAPFLSLDVALEVNAQRERMDAPGARRVSPALIERLRSLGAPVDEAATSGARRGAQGKRKGAGAAAPARAPLGRGEAAESATGVGATGEARGPEEAEARAAEALGIHGPDRMAALAQAALALPPERAAALAELAVCAAEEEPPADGWGYFLLAQLGGALSPERAAQVLGWLLDSLTGAPLRADMLWTGDGDDLRRIGPLLLRIGGEGLLVDAGQSVAEITARYA
ncbi:uncharacterized protein SOCEGT47_007630 [Sorangium cellulosum]|uniref:Uncharacterized protein n=1 Tax=Sorangium cellulosum TaxID=56 RepID=A0A4P2PU68_SORCE|nr:hypothetical protein [Sorangium cellulosum]AUX20295.1 uncharacterized protein SOCEGT47_007630 [Sorangium cellulosum]